ncbi:MAG: glycosyltransferase family 4 protein [FCB group bacterium]|jgi:glycosyltransferase involved in cell wall biosynthesis
MKILHTVETYFPMQTGMAEVTRQISERLVKSGHDVTIATTHIPERKDKVVNGVTIVDFNIHGNAVRGMQGDIDSYTDFLVNSEFDIVTFFAAQTWSTDIAFPILNRIKGKKVFVPTGFSSLYFPSYRKYYMQMKYWMGLCDMNIFLSNIYKDIIFARQNSVTKISVIPNGADEREFLTESTINFRKNYNIPEDNFLILHVGSRTGFKGHSEALDIFGRADIKNATLVMIGNEASGLYHSLINIFQTKLHLFNMSNKQKLNNKNILVLTTSREETVAAFKEADIFLFPSNIECSPLVLFECLASKTPFLATDVGNSIEIMSWSNSGIILPTRKLFGLCWAKIKKSAKILEEIYKDTDRRETMKEAGFKAWEEKFTWSKIAKDYESLYLSLFEK